MNRNWLLPACAAAVLAVSLASCSYLKSEGAKPEGAKPEQKPGGKLPALQVSPDLYVAQPDRPRPATAPAKASLTRKADNSAVLTVNEPFDRAWTRVRVALERLSFSITGQDQAKGLYSVQYVDPAAAQSQGFFARLNPFGSSKPAPKEYQVQVKNAGLVTEVNVLDKEGKEDVSDAAYSVLTQLHEQLK
jgi:uncharacterized lipoprotein